VSRPAYLRRMTILSAQAIAAENRRRLFTEWRPSCACSPETIKELREEGGVLRCVLHDDRPLVRREGGR
jgi:hypothetical protein